MSNPTSEGHQPDSHDDHSSPIRTPKQLVTVIIASFVVPIVIIIMLVNYVAFGGKEGAGSDGMSPEAIAKRLQPVGMTAAIVLELAAAGKAEGASKLVCFPW